MDASDIVTNPRPAPAAEELPAPPAPAAPAPSRREEHLLSAGYEAPRSALETRLARLWTAALQVTPIGVHDDFFELGGHSLMAAQLLVDIQHALGVEVTARTLFLQPTIAELAEVIEQAGAGGGGA
jgi:acyl carrier protein